MDVERFSMLFRYISPWGFGQHAEVVSRRAFRVSGRGREGGREGEGGREREREGGKNDRERFSMLFCYISPWGFGQHAEVVSRRAFRVSE